jgi:WD40 repeat protein
LLLAAQAFSMADTPSTSGALLSAVQRSPEAVRVIRSDASRMLALEMSPDGATLAANETLGGTTLYDVMSGERIGHYDGINALGALAWMPDGSAFATLNASADPDEPAALDVVIIDATTLDERARYAGRRDPVSDLAFSPDGRLLVAGPADTADGRTPEVTVWEVDHPGPPTRSIEVPDASDRDSDAISFDGSGSRVAVSMDDETALIDVRTGERTDTFEGSGGAFSPDGRSLVVNSAEGEDPDSLVLIDVSNGDRRPLHGAQTSGVRHRDFSRDSSMLATSGNDGLVRVWETATGREVYTLRGHTGRTLAGVFSPDGTTLYSTGLDRAIFSWDLVGRNTLEHVVAAPASPDTFGETFVVTSDESVAVIAPFGTTLLMPVAIASGARGDVIDAGHGIVAMLPSGGTTVIVGADDWSLSRWDVATGSLLAETDEASDLYPLAVTPDQSTVFVQVGPETIQAFDAATLEPRGDVLDVGAEIGIGAISPDGASLAVSTVDPYAVRVLELETGTQRSVTVPGFVRALAYSPDGAQLAAGDADGRVLIIDPAEASLSGQPAIMHDGLVTSVAYSADGSRFTSESTDGVVLMWEAATGRPIGPVQPGPPDRQARSTWSADGHTLLVMYNTGAVHAFETRPEAWLDYACRTAARQLTDTEWEQLLPDRPYNPACGAASPPTT